MAGVLRPAEPDLLAFDRARVELGLTPQQALAALNAYARSGDQNQEIVGIQKFIESPRYMNAGGRVFPAVMEALIELNERGPVGGGYTESVLTGGIGVGKTTVAVWTQLYQLYKLTCYDNPHSLFDLDPADEIVIVFQSINLQKAREVGFDRFRARVEMSPYFQHKAFAPDPEVKSQLIFPKRIIVKPVPATEAGTLSENVIGGVIDELNSMIVVEDSKRNPDGGVYDQAMELYRNIARRRESRFVIVGAALPGMLCLVSSARFRGQFTDRKVAEARENNRIFVFDKRLWDIRPDKFVADDWFKIYPGSETCKPYIVDPEHPAPEDEEDRVIDVPSTFKPSFERDILKAVRDIAGISTTAIHPFIPDPDKVAVCFGRRPSIFSRDDVDFETTQVKIHPERLTDPKEPRYMHVDLAQTRDSCGLAIGYVKKFLKVDRAGGVVETAPYVCLDGILEVRPPPSGEIQFHRIRDVIYKLTELGMDLRWITFDQFQCVSGESLVWTDRGLVRAKEVEIGDLVQSRIGPRKVVKRWSFGKRPVLRIITDDGHALEATEGHRLETRKGPAWKHRWVWEKVGNLSIGDVVRTWDGSAPPLLGPSQLVKLPLRPSFTGRSKVISVPETLTEDLAEWLGLVWGDGNVDEDGVHLSCALTDVNDAVAVFAKLGWTPKVSFCVDRACARLSISSRLLVRWLKVSGLSKSPNIPKAILESPARVQAAFLRGLYSADGHVDRNDGACCLSTKNLAWARYAQDFLRSAFGIQTRLITIARTGNHYATDATEHFVLRTRGPRWLFAGVVGFCYESKASKLDLHMHRPGRLLPTRIASIEASEAEVFDFEVEGDPSYVVNGLVSHNSTDMRQILRQKGYRTGLLSLDRDMVAYEIAKQAFYDRRVEAPAHELCLSEFVHLELNEKKQKVDHGATGSKDTSDGAAGVIAGLYKKRTLWLRHGIPMREIPRMKKVEGDDTVSEQRDTHRRKPGRMRTGITL